MNPVDDTDGPLEACCLQHVPGADERAGERPRADSAGAERAQAPETRRHERAACDREAKREEREERIERDRVLDLDERDPPHGGDRDKHDERAHLPD